MVTYGLIEVYDYPDLEQKAKWKVIHWLDENEYFSDMSEEDVAEHCMMNEYKFNVEGKPIHHLLLLDYNPKQTQTEQTEEI